jgi:O-antigen/teichoic acid export membrane protein
LTGRVWRRWIAGERQAIETVLANGLSALSVFAAGVVMARALGPEGRGQVAAHLVGIVMSVALGSLGISYAAAYAAARSGRARSAFRAVWTLGLASLAVTALLDVAVELFVVPNASFTEKTWAVLGAVLGQAAGITMGWIQGSRAMRVWNALRASPYALHLFLLLALARNGGLSVERCIAAYAVAHAVTLLGGLFVARTAKADGEASVAFSTRDTWQFARGIAVSAVLYQINQRLDQLCLAFLGRAGDLGVYASAVTLAGLGLPLGAGLAQATYAEGLHASGVERGRLARRRNRAALAATGACAVVLTVLARPLMVLLYGEPFAGGGPALAVLAWATVFLAGNYVAAESLRSAGKSFATIRADSIAVTVSVVLLPLGIAWLGILGAAVVSLLSYALGYTLNLRARMRLDAREMPPGEIGKGNG